MTTTTVASHHRLAGLASLAGTTIEWYDFFLYGTAAALVFNRLFFPELDPLSGLFAAFATYAVGFIGRPVGGLVFGHLGDRVGRKAMLIATLLLMGLPTVAIGLLPTHDQVGYWAAGALALLRFLQGVAVGGEWGGAVLMAVEHAPEGRKGFYGSLPQTGVGAGLVLSSLAMAGVSALPEADLLSWGWRLPFLASIVLLGVGWLIRARVPESPEFLRLQQHALPEPAPLRVVLSVHRRSVLTVIGARMAENAWFYLSATFALAYATGTLGLPRADILAGITAGALLSLLTMPLAGWLSDRIGQRRLYRIGVLMLIAYVWPFFALLGLRDVLIAQLALVAALGIVFPLMYAPESLLFARQVPAPVRYSGISLGVQVAGVLGGGLAPMIAAALLARGGGDPHLVVMYLLGLAAIALLAVSCMPADDTGADT